MTRIGIILDSTRPNRNGEQVDKWFFDIASRHHYAEWNNKAVGFVSYGAVGGARAVEHLRLVAGELQMADVRQQVALSLMTEFENFSVFKPGDYNLPALNTMLDQVVAWSTALAPLRDTAGVAA